MNCVICKNGEMVEGHATVTLEHGACTVIFQAVPADVCKNCGEYYLSEAVSEEVMRRAAIAAASGEAVTILQYAA